MELTKKILRDIANGKRTFEPEDQSPEAVEKFQPIAKRIIFAKENNLIEDMRQQKSMSRQGYGSYITVLLLGGLTLEGEKYLSDEYDTLPSKQMTSNTFTFNNSNGIQIGNHNNQQLQITIKQLVEKIESSESSEAEKSEAKSLLNNFLCHPLVSAIIGGAMSNF